LEFAISVVPVATLVATTGRDPGSFQQPNRLIECCRTQMQISLRGRDVGVPREVLNGLRCGASHRKVGAERVPQMVWAVARKPSPSSRPHHGQCDAVFGEALPVLAAQHALSSQVALLA
jgi:hypothetical protein